MRLLTAAVIVASMIGLAFAQTQPTRPSAYATPPTMPSAFATSALNPCYPSHGYFNPASSCYSGTLYPSYSAVTPFEFPKESNPKAGSQGSDNLNEDQAKLLIETKGYLNVSRLEKDRRGIWRGKASLKDGRPVDITLDLEGNIYSELSRLHIRIEPPPSTR
jgi:hypothetical protein